MTDGHRTSTIPRPRSTELPPSRSEERPGRLSDFTTPIERTKQLVPQKRGRLVVALFATVIALAIGAALFVLPIKSWLQQRDDLTTRNGELETLNEANDRLQLEVDRLQTDAGIAEAAREEIDYVEEGEQRLTVLGDVVNPTVLPTGWPYDLVTQIVNLRRAEAEAATAATASTEAPATTTAPTTAATVATTVAAPTETTVAGTETPVVTTP